MKIFARVSPLLQKREKTSKIYSMEQGGFIVGIELGTSKIVGLLARRNAQGIISVLASESTPSESSVKHGVVYNIDEVAGKVKRIIQLLENKTDKKIAKAYFNVSGKSLQSVDYVESLSFEQATPVRQEQLDRLEKKAKEYCPDNGDVNYGIISPRIYVDGVLTTQFNNATATLIEKKFQLITGRPNINHNIRAVARKAGIEVAGLLVGNITASAMLLSPESKQKGCALIDFGAGTTSVSVYKEGFLRYYKVIPFGGRTVTKDVQALGFPPEVAEEYKIRYGKVGKERNKQAPNTPVAPSVNIKELNKIIQLRYEEIVKNALHLLTEAGLTDQIPEGFYLTGSASQQTGLTDYIAEQANLPVRKAIPHRVLINNVAELVQNPGYATILSILLFATTNCEKIKPKQEVSRQELIDTNSDNQLSSEKKIDKSTEVVQHENPVKDNKVTRTEQKEKEHEVTKVKKTSILSKFLNGMNLFGEEPDEE